MDGFLRFRMLSRNKTMKPERTARLLILGILLGLPLAVLLARWLPAGNAAGRFTCA